MWAFYQKVLKERPEDLHTGKLPLEESKDEKRIQIEVIKSIMENGVDGFSYKVNRGHSRTVSDTLIRPDWKPRPQQHLRSKTSHASMISYVGSVQSFTSIKYRSPSGQIQTRQSETYSQVQLQGDELERTMMMDELWNEFKNDSETYKSRRISTPSLVTRRTADVSLNAKSSIACKDHPDVVNGQLKESVIWEIDRVKAWPRRRSLPILRGQDITFNKIAPKALTDLNIGFTKLGTENFANINIPHQALNPTESFLPPSKSGETSIIHGFLPDSDHRVTYLENKLVRMRWKCVSH